DLRPRRSRRRSHHGRADAGREGRHQPSRPRRSRPADPPARPSARAAMSMNEPSKTGAAALSVASNSALILLKAIAGAITGSVALLTEALHSATDLVASIVALFSVRAADVPADESHPYGHEKIEDMAAAIEGVLILVGSVVIAFEAVRHLIQGTCVQRLGVGIAVLSVSIVVNLLVSRRLSRR